MTRKSKIRPEEMTGDRQTDANSRVGRGPDAAYIERIILDTSPLPMAALAGSDHILRYVNSDFCRLACKSKDELIGNPFKEVVPWEGCLALLDHVYSTEKAQSRRNRNGQNLIQPFG